MLKHLVLPKFKRGQLLATGEQVEKKVLCLQRHSQGEYIFDHSWAGVAMRLGMGYCKIVPSFLHNFLLLLLLNSRSSETFNHDFEMVITGPRICIRALGSPFQHQSDFEVSLLCIFQALQEQEVVRNCTEETAT